MSSYESRTWQSEVNVTRTRKAQFPMDGEVKDATCVIGRCVDTSKWKVDGA
jgi:hypothetical protein